jgi:hypothetical protein
MPRFLHALTAINALGAVACFVMAIGSAVSAQFWSSLAVSGGSALMLAIRLHQSDDGASMAHGQPRGARCGCCQAFGNELVIGAEERI